jgi:cell division septum initiation protein DivIVA
MPDPAPFESFSPAAGQPPTLPTFSVVRRKGYNPQQVDAWASKVLEQLATAKETAEWRKNEADLLREQGAGTDRALAIVEPVVAQRPLGDADEMTAAGRVLAMAEQWSSDAIKGAEQKAADIVAEAKQTAEQIVHDVQVRVDEIAAERRAEVEGDLQGAVDEARRLRAQTADVARKYRNWQEDTLGRMREVVGIFESVEDVPSEPTSAMPPARALPALDAAPAVNVVEEFTHLLEEKGFEEDPGGEAETDRGADQGAEQRELERLPWRQ